MPNKKIHPEGSNEMRTRLLITTIALASVFTVQQAVAKSSTKTADASKKHHKKKHPKKTAAALTTAPTVSVAPAAS